LAAADQRVNLLDQLLGKHNVCAFGIHSGLTKIT